MLQSLYTERMAVYRGVFSSDLSAGMVRADALLTSDVPCRDQTAGANEQVMNAALGVPIDHTIFTDYELRHDDVLVVTGEVAGTATSVTMRVQGSPIRRNAIGGMAGFFVANCQEIKL